MANDAISALNRVKFSGLDFNTIEDDILARIQIQFAADYNDFATSSLGIMLIDIISFGLDTLSFYVDRRATDNYLFSARTAKSVSRLSRQLGYKMGGAVSSSVDLQVVIKVVKPFTIPLPQNYQFQGPNGLIFSAAKEVDWSPVEQSTATQKSVPCYEGYTASESFVSDGSPNQVFQLKKVPDGKFVAQGSVAVTVDGGPWQEIDFLDFEQTNQFEIGYNDSPATVRFGDSVAGNIPKRGSSIVATYVITSGKSGKVTGNTITSAVAPLVVSGQAISLSINNKDGSSGGDDAEDIDHAKSFAGRVFKSRQVAITRGDYNALAGSFADPLFGRVAVAQAISSRTSANDLAFQSMKQAIQNALAPVVAVMYATVAALVIDLDLIATLLGDVLVQENNIATKSLDIQSKATALTDGLRTNKNLANDISAQATAGQSYIDTFPTATPSQLTTADKNTLKNFFSVTSSLASTIGSSVTTQIQQMGIINDDTNLIGTDLVTAGTYLNSIDRDRLDIIAIEGTNNTDPTLATGMYLRLVGTQFDVTGSTPSYLTGAAHYIDPAFVSSTGASAVSINLQAMDDHLDVILSADCKANLVTVPILARDAAGFYIKPSNSLLASLQAYLNARKEVTQTVVVTDGSFFLIEAVITIRVGVKLGFSTSQVGAAVTSVVDGILRGRQFGASLYVSDLTTPILNVTGVAFTNVVINGYSTIAGGCHVFGPTATENLLDASGNLIIPTGLVITKGSCPNGLSTSSVWVQTEVWTPPS